MEQAPWLEQVRRELMRRGLPARYVKRLVSELTDHIHDCTEDFMSMDAQDLRWLGERMGRPGELAEAATEEFRRRGFCGRHPLLAFGVLPAVALFGLWLACVIGIVLTLNLIGLVHRGSNPPSNTLPPIVEQFRYAIPWVVSSVIVVPSIAAAGFFCWLARRNAVGWKWSLAACTIVAVLTGLLHVQLQLPVPPAHGHLTVGLAFKRFPSVAQFLQFAIPMAIGAWVAWRQNMRERRYEAS
jgi:hypothetical protein